VNTGAISGNNSTNMWLDQALWSRERPRLAPCRPYVVCRRRTL